MSTGSQTRLRADSEQLARYAELLRQAAGALGHGRLLEDAGWAAGDDALAEALVWFDRVWGAVWAQLDDDLVRMADALTVLAGAYQQVDSGLVGGFTRLVHRLWR